MKIELKKISCSTKLSQGTWAYTATLYINGKAFANLMNNGEGGSDSIDNASSLSTKEWLKLFNNAALELLKNNPELGNLGKTSHMIFELWANEKVTEHLVEKDNKRIKQRFLRSLKHPVAIKDGRAFELRGHSPSLELLNSMKSRGYTTLNDLDPEVAFGMWLPCAFS